MLLPVGTNFESMEALMKDSRYGELSALLLAESGYAPLNPPDPATFYGGGEKGYTDYPFLG